MAAAWLMFTAGIALTSATGRAADSSSAGREDQLRAAYLVNFAKFIQWPAGVEAGQTFCFVGGAGIRDALNAATAARTDAPVLVTRALARGENTSGCQILYVESGAPFATERLVAAPQPAQLTVSDAHDFSLNEGVIELFTEGNRLRFSINLDNARRAGLKISSNLLQLASHVEEAHR